MSEGFRKPPPGARPWVFWVWLQADTTPEAITTDLEEMRAKGIEGAILYDTGGATINKYPFTMVPRDKGYQKVPTSYFDGSYSTPLPTAPLPTWSPLWRERVRFACKEAGRIGIKLCLSNGLAGTSGAIAAEDGQQKLVWSETAATGPSSYHEALPDPAESIPATNTPSRKPGGPRSGAGPDLHEVAVLAIPDRDGCTPGDVIDLTGNLDAGKQLRWEVPAGGWKILRFAHVPTGAKNTWGLYTDGMSTAALDATWDVTMGPLLKEMAPEERRGLLGVEDDSWEAGETTWTKRFAAEFQRLRGYDLIPWLPVLAGKKVGSPEQGEGVRRDFYRTVADLIAVNHYAHLQELASQNGLVCYSEPAGPNSAQLDTMLDCKEVDHAMGEFWMPSPHRPNPVNRFLLRNAASANHLYGARVTRLRSPDIRRPALGGKSFRPQEHSRPGVLRRAEPHGDP